MRLQFVSPILHKLDAVEADILACVVWEDVRPMDGLAALCDWRYGGRLSRLLMNRFVTGKLDEVILLPGRPLLTTEKLLLLGAGPRAQFDELRFDRIVLNLLRVVDGVASRSAIVELPGRHDDTISPERAADRFLDALTKPGPGASNARQSHHHSRTAAWTLVCDLESRRRIEQHMLDERRRIRPDG